MKDKKTHPLSDTFIVSHDKFLEILKPFKEVRGAIGGGEYPFEFINIKVDRQEVIDIVRTHKMLVTYQIMHNSAVDNKLNDILYIKKMRMTILDKK